MQTWQKKVLFNEVNNLLIQTWHSGLYLHMYLTKKVIISEPLAQMSSKTEI